jgi:2-C-methyl-D-erythritol 4-phosphate cytidylyltransferase
MNKYAVIVAGGKGERMGSAVPKQFLPLSGKPVLYYTVKAFIDAYPDMQLILVLPQHHISYAQMVLTEFPQRIDLTIVAGGETRFHSVKNGLAAIPQPGVVFVHDGVRPLLSTSLIQRCYEQAIQLGSAIPAIPVADSVRMVTDEGSHPVNRTHLRIIQTPQTFLTSILVPAFNAPYSDSFTDEATVAEAAGHTIHLIDGERYNIKITTPEDLIMAEAILQQTDRS